MAERECGGGPPAAREGRAGGVVDEDDVQVASSGRRRWAAGAVRRAVRVRVSVSSVEPQEGAGKGAGVSLRRVGGQGVGGAAGTGVEVGWGVSGVVGEAASRCLEDERVAREGGLRGVRSVVGVAWSVAEAMLVADGARRMKVGRVVESPWRGTLVSVTRGRVHGEVAANPRLNLRVPEACEVPDPCDDGLRGVWRAYCAGTSGWRAAGRAVRRDGVVGVAPRAGVRFDLVRSTKARGVPLRPLLSRALRLRARQGTHDSLDHDTDEERGQAPGQDPGPDDDHGAARDGWSTTTTTTKTTVDEVANALDTRGDGLVHVEDWGRLAWPWGTWAVYAAAGCGLERGGRLVAASPRCVVEWQCDDAGIGIGARGAARRALGWELKGRTAVPVTAAVGALLSQRDASGEAPAWAEAEVAACRLLTGRVRMEIGASASLVNGGGGFASVLRARGKVGRRYALVRAGWAFARIAEEGPSFCIGLGDGGAFTFGALGL